MGGKQGVRMLSRTRSIVSRVGIVVVPLIAVWVASGPRGLPEAKAQGTAPKQQAAPAAGKAALAGRGITIVEATEGMNWWDFKVGARAKKSVRAGNVTTAIAGACNSKQGSCSTLVGYVRLSDPSPGFGTEIRA
jgi:hypothetical protein